ncbi:MAG TPA: hypothetical protein VNN79_15280 [Actinomycetota bacterium]|nr:hypothetical protein [Actinomycetota bacterium]
MGRSRRCLDGGQPRWVRILESNTPEDGHLGYVSFRIVGWRHPALRAVRPWTWLHSTLLSRWGPRPVQPRRPDDGGPPDAGVREPRRPSPLAGTDGVALTEPHTG